MPYADSDYERSWKMQTKGVTLSPVKPEGHTPGPWYCHVHTAVAEESDGEYGTATCITTASEGEYASTGSRGDLIAWVPHDRRHGPNARLIAAAPELLAALKQTVGLLSYASQDGGVYGCNATEWFNMESFCRTAIAKAEGRSE